MLITQVEHKKQECQAVIKSTSYSVQNNTSAVCTLKNSYNLTPIDSTSHNEHASVTKSVLDP